MLLGCRSGAACPFVHEPSDTAQRSTAAAQHYARRSQSSRPLQRSVGAGESPIVPLGNTGRHYAAVNTSRITHRPVPQSQLADPRVYQVSQLRRRFTPEERNEDSFTILTFPLKPSDPDFPFELDALYCTLRIPFDYPSGGKPTLRVTNPDMERGYQINIERGFDRIVASAGSSTLLACLNTLDKQLEGLLSSQKADTIKLVSHAGKPELLPSAATGSANQAPMLPSTAPSTAPMPTSHSSEQISQAKGLRDAQAQQLEARLGHMLQFSKSADGLAFTVPIDPPKRQDLPVELQALRLIKLIVPETYNLSPCRIELVGVQGEAVGAVVNAFNERASQAPQMSLLNHVNYLSQNIQKMAKRKAPPPKSIESTPSILKITDKPGDPLDRPHVVAIPRPLEWDDNGGDTDSSDSSLESDNESVVDEPPAADQSTSVSTVERGVLVSFPHISLHGIELLEIGMLNITVKCNRCKDTRDVTNLQNNADGAHARADRCKKCGSVFNVGFRVELLHSNSIRAGYLDLDGCSIVDLLPRYGLWSCVTTSLMLSSAHLYQHVLNARLRIYGLELLRSGVTPQWLSAAIAIRR